MENADLGISVAINDVVGEISVEVGKGLVGRIFCLAEQELSIVATSKPMTSIIIFMIIYALR